jgi:putative transposase
MSSPNGSTESRPTTSDRRNSTLVGRDSVESPELRQRRHPAKGVFIFRGQATIVFVTVCSRCRKSDLANAVVHDGLLRAWNKADRWVIGAYMIMPDHIHFFCSPLDETMEIEKWMTFWKRQLKRVLGENAPQFQIDGFHHRLRGEESYTEKWEYVRANPVRAGLVEKAEDWPYQGVLNELRC